MLRDILFRGKRIDNGEWVEGAYFPAKDGALICTNIAAGTPVDETAMCIAWSVDPDTIGQYTGLIDENGDRIFEGDLITIPGSKRQGLPAPVKWSNFDARFEICRRGFNPICLDGGDGIYEVIGNIHDNPELMEGE